MLCYVIRKHTVTPGCWVSRWITLQKYVNRVEFISDVAVSVNQARVLLQPHLKYRAQSRHTWHNYATDCNNVDDFKQITDKSEYYPTFCWQVDVDSPVQARHLESNTNTDVCPLNVTLSLDTDTNHKILDHITCMSTMENGMSHWTSDGDTSRARVKYIVPSGDISCRNIQVNTLNEMKFHTLTFQYSITCWGYSCHLYIGWKCDIRTNVQLNVSVNANWVRNIETKLQGFGPRTSHVGPARVPVIVGGKLAATEQSAPRKPATKEMVGDRNKTEFVDTTKCISAKI